MDEFVVDIGSTEEADSIFGVAASPELLYFDEIQSVLSDSDSDQRDFYLRLWLRILINTSSIPKDRRPRESRSNC